jgi:hypothetical protein
MGEVRGCNARGIARLIREAIPDLSQLDRSQLTHSTVFDPQMAFFRKIVFKILGSGTIMTIIIMWLALPLYWGSREYPHPTRRWSGVDGDIANEQCGCRMCIRTSYLSG